MRIKIRDKKLKSNIVKYKILSSILTWTISFAIITMLLFIFRGKVEPYIKIVNVLYIMLVAYAVISTFIFPFIEVNTWAYEISNKKVEYVHGIYSIKSVTVPISRISYVTTEENPVLNYFGLSKIQINTTSGEHYLENISKNDKEQIINHITEILFKEKEENNEKDK